MKATDCLRVCVARAKGKHLVIDHYDDLFHYFLSTLNTVAAAAADEYHGTFFFFFFSKQKERKESQVVVAVVERRGNTHNLVSADGRTDDECARARIDKKKTKTS